VASLEALAVMRAGKGLSAIVPLSLNPLVRVKSDWLSSSLRILGPRNEIRPAKGRSTIKEARISSSRAAAYREYPLLAATPIVVLRNGGQVGSPAIGHVPGLAIITGTQQAIREFRVRLIEGQWGPTLRAADEGNASRGRCAAVQNGRIIHG
jgi:hypothetical protein